MQLRTLNSSQIRGTSDFEDDGTQNYLVFYPVYKHFKTVANGNKVTNFLMKLLNFLLYLIIVLLQHFSKTRVNLFIVNEINLWSNIKGEDFACGNSLFGTVKLTKNADSDKYKYSCYGNGRKFSKNVIKFAADLS